MCDLKVRRPPRTDWQVRQGIINCKLLSPWIRTVANGGRDSERNFKGMEYLKNSWSLDIKNWQAIFSREAESEDKERD